MSSIVNNKKVISSQPSYFFYYFVFRSDRQVIISEKIQCLTQTYGGQLAQSH